MYETNIDSLDFKPLTLYSFFPKNKRLKLLKQDTNTISKNNMKLNTTNDRFSKEKNNTNKKKNMQWNNGNSKYNFNCNFEQSRKILKFNGIASFTSSNFYNKNNNNDNISKKFSFKYKYSFRSSQKKNKQNEMKNKKQERKKSKGESFFKYMQIIDNKEINEKFYEQFLNDYNSKLPKNFKNMKENNSNKKNYYIFNLKNSKNNLIHSSKNKKHVINNNYFNSIKFKNLIRLNSDKLYNYLPYLNSSFKNKKKSAKTHKKLLVYGSYNINTINSGFNPTNGSKGLKNIQNYYNNVHTLTKSNTSNNNTYKNYTKNNFYASSNQIVNSFNFNNNNVTTNSNISNTGNNNIIFNNAGSIGSINNYNNINIHDSSRKNNFIDENNKTNTVVDSHSNNFDTKILLKKSNTNKLSDIMKNENHKINDIEKDINDTKKNNKDKEKIIRNLNFLKKDRNDNNDKDKEKEIKNDNNNIKVRAFSTEPYKNRNKNEKKNEISIDNNNINNQNKNKEKKVIDQKYIFSDKLSKYEIGNSLGKGAYAIVKIVTNKITKEKYAMKIYEKEKLDSNSKKNCVYKEIQILKKLRHKNIAKLIEVITTEKQILIIQELIEGISLREYYNNEIRNQKGISIHKEKIFKIIFRQIFEAMDYIHKLGIAHRDIKLENILIKKNYEIKIIDFGFGMYNPENKLEKFFCGTPNYMPPEIAEKKPYIGQLADMWSLGILVYKIFCADFPFKGKDEKELYKAIKLGKFTMASYTPEYAKKIITSLIVLNPNKRMTCKEVLNSDWLKDK